MWGGVGYNECLQKGNGNFDDSDLSQEGSEVSQTSQGTDSSQEVTELLRPLVAHSR